MKIENNLLKIEGPQDFELEGVDKYKLHLTIMGVGCLDLADEKTFPQTFMYIESDNFHYMPTWVRIFPNSEIDEEFRAQYNQEMIKPVAYNKKSPGYRKRFSKR